MNRPLSVLETAPALCVLLGASFDVFDAPPARELLPERYAAQGSINSE